LQKSIEVLKIESKQQVTKIFTKGLFKSGSSAHSKAFDEQAFKHFIESVREGMFVLRDRYSRFG